MMRVLAFLIKGRKQEVRVLRKARNFLRHAARHLAAGDWRGWMARLRAERYFTEFQDARELSNVPSHSWRFGIIAPPHMAFLEQRVREGLQSHGWAVEVFDSSPSDFACDWYIVMSPELFSELPLRQKGILLLDNLPALKKYTENRESLEQAFAILVTAFGDIEYLANHGIVFPKVHFIPIEQSGETEQNARHFAFMFDRFLVAQGFLPGSWVRHMELPISLSSGRVALSLPETTERRRVFTPYIPDDYLLFNGIRRHPGWVGCGLSYWMLAHHALKQGVKNLSVMEDDVELPTDFPFRMPVVQEFLTLRDGEWDVFCGLIAGLPTQAEILTVEIFKGVTFVTINTMTSMVFNIYSRKALEILSGWDAENADASNTIDRYLGNREALRVIVALPFLVGHREELDSTLWGASNRLYSGLIKASEQALITMAARYQHDAKRESTSHLS
jgi:hypothetical protein